MSLKLSRKYIKSAFALVVIYNLAWSVGSQSTLKDESSNQINSSSVTDLPATAASTSTERTSGGWFGGLFGPTRAVPNNSCNCCKFHLHYHHFSKYFLLQPNLDSTNSFVYFYLQLVAWPIMGLESLGKIKLEFFCIWLRFD